MKRTVFGLVLLLVLLAAGITSALGMSRYHEKVAALLDQSAAQAMDDDLPGAMQTAQQAWEQWERGWNISAAFTDHDPLEQIDGGFAQLKLYGEAGEALPFAAVCVELAKQVEAIGDAHGAQWWNIL